MSTAPAPAGTRRRSLPRIFPPMPEVTRRVLFQGIAGHPADRPPLPSAAEVPKLIEERLSSLALRARDDGALQVSREVASQLRTAAFAQAERTTIVLSHLGDILDCLDGGGVDVLVVKGLGISRLEASMQDRPFSDVDVLVAPRSFAHALTLLRRAGFVEEDRTAQPRDWCNVHCREAINLKRSDGASVDLHHRLPPWLWTGALGFDRLWNAAETLRVGDRDVRIPCATHQALISYLHVVSDRGRPGKSVRVWRDIAVTTAAADPAALVDEAGVLGLAAWGAWILEQLPPDVCPPAVLEGLSASVSPVPATWRLRLLSACSAREMEVLSHLCRLPLPNAALYAVALIFPSPAFLARHYTGRWATLRWLSSGIWRSVGGAGPRPALGRPVQTGAGR